MDYFCPEIVFSRFPSFIPKLCEFVELAERLGYSVFHTTYIIYFI